MKKKKNNGNVLQITLILLFMLSLNIFSLCHLTILNSRGFQSIKQTNDIRLLKNILIANYKYENQNSILLSNYLELENYTISYTVDDMGDYFLIETRLKNDRYKLNITFYLELDKEKNVIKVRIGVRIFFDYSINSKLNAIHETVFFLDKKKSVFFSYFCKNFIK